MRESKIESYLHDQVTIAGGTTRKLTGRINDPDRLVIWPAPHQAMHFVETKAPGKTPRPGQLREHTRLRKFGCEVFVLDTKPMVDSYVRTYA